MVSFFDKYPDNCYADKNWTDWSIVSENQTRLIIPSGSIISNDPSKYPVFFNPEAKVNRDLSILIYRNFLNKSKKNITFVDSMAASGARGLRIGKEIPFIKEIYVNDINPFAIQLTKINSVLNDLYHKCFFYNQSICSFLSNVFEVRNRATIIDLDPFGTPAPYLDCVLRSVENDGMVSVTATDTAVLEGVYPNVCYRKYYSIPIRTKYSIEIGARILLSALSLIASRLDLIIKPFFTHSYRNYIRIYCKIIKSNSLANKNRKNLGYITHCKKCANREQFNANPPSLCSMCKEKVFVAGPLWIKNTFDKSLIERVLGEFRGNTFTSDTLYKRNFEYYNYLYPFFLLANYELDDISYHFNNDEIGKIQKNSVISINKIVEKLINNGFKASKTVFSTNGFKTNASVKEIREILQKH